MTDVVDFDIEIDDDLPEDKLTRIRALAGRQLVEQQEVERLEKELTEAKEKLNKTSVVLIPELMQEIGISSFKLDSGEELVVDQVVQASISVANREKAFSWLRNNGFDGIIKNRLQVDFNKGEEALSQKAIEALKAVEIEAYVEPSIHAATLKSFVKERLAELGEEDSSITPEQEGDFIDDESSEEKKEKEPFPKEVFGVYVFPQAKIVQPKVKKPKAKKK